VLIWGCEDLRIWGCEDLRIADYGLRIMGFVGEKVKVLL
jgi:hypothetical protein